MTTPRLAALAQPEPYSTSGARLTRRALLLWGAGAATLGAAGIGAGQAFADQWLELSDDLGAPIPNLRTPSELDPFQLPGVLWFGPTAPDVTLFEFADYNCSVCKQAAPQLDALVRGTSGLRLGFIHNPILSPQSREAARVAMLVCGLPGHRRPTRSTVSFSLCGRRERRARAVCGERVRRRRGASQRRNDKAGGRRASAQEKLANAIGFSVTPSYVLNGIGLFGHPGPKALAKMVQSVKDCDALICA